MESGYSIDLFLLQKFQNVSDWMQDYLGFNNFAIAKLLKIAMIMSFLLREALSFINGVDNSEIIVLISSLVIIVKIEFLSTKAEQSVKNKHGIINPAVIEYAATRIIMQFVAIAAFGFLIKHLCYILTPSVTVITQFNEWKELFWDIFGMLIFFVTYFSSCTPKPYKPSKARKFIESFSSKEIMMPVSS